MAAFYQRCSDETRPDVGNMYVVNALDGNQLAEALKIMARKPLGGGISRCCAKPFGASNGTDYCYLAVNIWMLLEIPECLAHKARHAKTIGGDGAQLTLCIQFSILITDARTMEIEIDAAHFVN